MNYETMEGVDERYYKGFSFPIRKNRHLTNYSPSFTRKAIIKDTKDDLVLEDFSIFVEEDGEWQFYAPSSHLERIVETVRFDD